MKKNSYERVIGKISIEKKKEIIEQKEVIFKNQNFEELIGKEREKTLEELEIIDLANKATNEIRRKYGLEDFNIPSKNIHILKKEEWTNTEISAFYWPWKQSVAMQDESHKTIFAKKIFHEMIHFKSYQALQATAEDEPKLQDYRMGLVIKTRNGENSLFSSLNEGITEEITKRYVLENIESFSENPLFAQEINQTIKIISEHPNATDELGIPIFNKDVFYAEVAGVTNDNKPIVITDGFTYAVERSALNILIDKLFEKNKENFTNKDEIFELFARGAMTGNILPMGKLIDNTFGVGTLRKIGELDDNAEVFKQLVDSL